jgi:hypothetical protein
MTSEIDQSRQTRPKTGGRQRGTPNRVTADVRDAFADLVRGNLGNVQTWLDRVAAESPEKALELLLQLSRYVLPELKAMAIDVRPQCGDLRRLSVAELEQIIAEESEQARLPALDAEYADLLGSAALSSSSPSRRS